MTSRDAIAPQAEPSNDELRDKLRRLEQRLARDRERLDNLTEEQRRGIGAMLESISEDIEDDDTPRG
jgi:hypothetical protein